MYWNQNQGLRAVILNDSKVDIQIIGFAVEKNHKDAPEVDNSKVSNYTIHYVLDGKGYIIFKGKKIILNKGSLFVTFPNQQIRLRQDREEPWKIGWIVCDGLKVADYLDRIGITPDNPYLKLEDDKRLQTIFSVTPYDCAKEYAISDAIALSAFYQFIVMVHMQNPNREERGTKSYSESHVERAIEYISQNYSNPQLTLTVTAEAIGVSPKYLSSIFKKTTKIPFSKFVLNKRISAANALIEEGCHVVSEVAYKVGFSSPYYFSNVYKKYNTESPRAHIKQFSNNGKNDKENN